MRSKLSPARPAILPPALAGPQPVALPLDFAGVTVDSAKIKADAYLQIYRKETPHKLLAIAERQRLHGGVKRRLMLRHFKTEIFGRSVSDEGIEALSATYTLLVHQAVLARPLIPSARELLAGPFGHAAWHSLFGYSQQAGRPVSVRGAGASELAGRGRRWATPRST